MKPYLTTSEAAEICRVSRGTILRWIREGRIHAISTMGGHNRLSAESLQRALQTMGLPIPDAFAAASSEASDVRILIVDDDADLRALLKTLLDSRFPSIPIREAGNGFEAGLLLAQFKPNFILLDAALPGLSGEEVCRMIRKAHSLSKVFILGMTGHTEKIRKMTEAGADVCLPKPFEGRDMLNFVSGFKTSQWEHSHHKKAG